MFDRLIESNSAAAEFKPRRKFFMVSSVVVGILFATAVVASLYAQEIDLGTDNFELVQLLAPVTADAPEPPKPKQQPKQQQQTDTQKSELPSRQVLMARVDQPQKAPSEISTTPNTHKAIPDEGRFILDVNKPESDGSGFAKNDGTIGSSSAGDPGSGNEVASVEIAKKADPPPVPKAEAKRPVTISKGVVNGEATNLPKPPYPPHAKAIGLTGDVNVQILIDERGNVASARAINGHPFLKPGAEQAARNARFAPTLLSGQPVKVTGVIVYRFSR